MLLEGDSITNGYFLKTGLIDKISLLIYLGIDSLAEISSVFEYLGQSDEKPAQVNPCAIWPSKLLAAVPFDFTIW